MRYLLLVLLIALPVSAASVFGQVFYQNETYEGAYVSILNINGVFGDWTDEYGCYEISIVGLGNPFLMYVGCKLDELEEPVVESLWFEWGDYCVPFYIESPDINGLGIETVSLGQLKATFK